MRNSLQDPLSEDVPFVSCHSKIHVESSADLKSNLVTHWHYENILIIFLLSRPMVVRVILTDIYGSLKGRRGVRMDGDLNCQKTGSWISCLFKCSVFAYQPRHEVFSCSNIIGCCIHSPAMLKPLRL